MRGAMKTVGIERIHMEEDAGKLLHEGFPWSGEKSGVDFNRSGVPLIEIVSRPDIRCAEEAHEYLTALKSILLYTAVSDGNMEEGSLRCDANVSVRPVGREALGTRTEIKNLNSFRNVARAIEHEVARQAAVLDSGGRITQETRLWNADRNETVSMRSKEDAHDYRYFPEPDLPPLVRRRRMDRPGPARPCPSFRPRSGDASWPSTAFPTTTPASSLLEGRRRLLRGRREGKRQREGHVELGHDRSPSQAQGATGSTSRRRPSRAPIWPSSWPSSKPEPSAARSRRSVFEKIWASGESPRTVVEREGLVQISR